MPNEDNQGNQQLMLLLLERKWGKLLISSQVLSNLLRDPAVSRLQIETTLRANGLERELLLARHDQIQNGSNFNFPNESTIKALREAINNLETVIARTAAVSDLIQATNGLINTMQASKI